MMEMAIVPFAAEAATAGGSKLNAQCSGQHGDLIRNVTPEPNTLDDGEISEEEIQVFGIRHGKSTANEFMSRPGNIWGDPTFCDDPSFVDAPLSEHGKQQCRDLAKLLLSGEIDVSWLRDIDLVLVSPLTRCLMTYKYGIRPFLEKLPSKPTVLVFPLIRERVYTASDTGRPWRELQKEFKDDSLLDWSEMQRLEEETGTSQWWYHVDPSSPPPEWRPHGEGQWYAVPGEPRPIFEARMDELHDWLRNRRERSVLLVTHWAILRHWTNGGDTENCAICSWKLNKRHPS